MAMFRHTVQRRARVLTHAEFLHVLKVAELTRDPERNHLVLCLSHALGLRVSEMARLTIRDVLYPSGRVKDEISLQPSTTKFNKGRTVPVSSKRLIKALDAYLDHRIERGLGCPAGATEFRGLAPDLPLIFSGRGGGFTLVTKRRKLESGVTEEYLACDPLENLFRNLYRSAGLRGASSHSGRRYYATTLLRQGASIETIAHLLGHADVDYSYPYTEPDRATLIRAFEIAL